MIHISPGALYKYSAKYLPYLAILSGLCLAYGLYLAFYDSPADYQQGEAVRIMYIHVPAAWMSLMIYSIMAGAGACYLIWQSPTSDLIARNAAPIGASFAFITLSTGSIWGQPIWGTWWVWDARLTSMLILLFLYLGYIALASSIDQSERRAKVLSVLAIIGAINVPIVKFSVDFWNSLHQGASILRIGGPAIHASMLKPLALMFGGCFGYFITILLIRVNTDIIQAKIMRMRMR